MVVNIKEPGEEGEAEKEGWRRGKGKRRDPEERRGIRRNRIGEKEGGEERRGRSYKFAFACPLQLLDLG